MRLAADTDQTVRAGVAAAAGALVSALGQRGDRLRALGLYCQDVEGALLPGGAALQPWRGVVGGAPRGAAAAAAEAGSGEAEAAAALKVCLGAEEVAALCKRLLMEEPEPQVQVGPCS